VTTRNEALIAMPDTLALAGLVIGAALYWLLVRRRASGRSIGGQMVRALQASNEIALARIRDGPRRRAEALAAIDDRPGSEVVAERRSGDDRRGGRQPWRGRGRRTGGDRRRR
jgi:hypothetical protein